MVSYLLVAGEGHDNEVEVTNYHLLGELALRELLVEQELKPSPVHQQCLPTQRSFTRLLCGLHIHTVHQAVGGLREEEDDGHLLLLLLCLEAGAAPTEDWGLGVGVGDIVVMTAGTAEQFLWGPLLLTLILPAT